MDQLKIGKFIADCRKEKKLTQMQLAEKLGITDKAVSKWERGIAMPDSSIMLDVCDILEISVNELLSGEKINMEEQSKKTEELLLEFKRKEEQLRKKLFINAWILHTILCLLYFTTATLSALAFFSEYIIASFIIFCVSVVVFTAGDVLLWKMEYDAGPFVCQDCQHEFIPKFREVFFSFPLPVSYKIRAKCPKCGNKTWAKKILPK